LIYQKKLKKYNNKLTGEGIFKDNLEILKKSYIPEKYHNILAVLNINIPTFFKFELMYKDIKISAVELQKIDSAEGNNVSDDYNRDAIVIYIIKYLKNINLHFKNIDEDIKSYFTFVKNNINVGKDSQNNRHVDYLGIFIIMHKTFVINNFWMLLPKENKFFFSYVIQRIFQSIDEGKDKAIKDFEEKKNPYSLINSESDKNNIQKINFLKVIQTKTDNHPYSIYRHIRYIWEFDKKGVDKHNKRLLIISAATKGILEFILLASIQSLSPEKLKKITMFPYSNKKPTNFISYLKHQNLAMITFFLNTQIHIITNDSNISNDNTFDKFLKYLWSEYKMLLNL